MENNTNNNKKETKEPIIKLYLTQELYNKILIVSDNQSIKKTTLLIGYIAERINKELEKDV